MTHLSNQTHWQAAGHPIYSHHILMSIFRFGTLHARIDGLAWSSSVMGFNQWLAWPLDCLLTTVILHVVEAIGKSATLLRPCLGSGSWEYSGDNASTSTIWHCNRIAQSLRMVSFLSSEGLVSNLQTQLELRVYLTDLSSGTDQTSVYTHAPQKQPPSCGYTMSSPTPGPYLQMIFHGPRRVATMHSPIAL